MYIEADDAAAYFAERLGTDAWDVATDSDKTKALAQATRIIDSLAILGTKTVSDQDNAFPRTPDTEPPQAVLDACCEIALSLLDGRDPEKLLEASLNREVRLGSMNITKETTEVPEYIAAGVPSVTAWRLLLPFLVDPLSVELKRCS